ncbi:MAG: hypothetical protein H0W72_15065 [Planctomycetes bacterium]|nr:hypothetical protein [Planctomycetota bacterium]
MPLSPRRLLPLLAIATTCVIGGCPPRGTAHVAEVSPAMVDYAAKQWPGSDPLQLQRGRALLTSARCTECHGLPSPTSESAEKWPGIVTRMGKKAEMDATEREDLLRFILAARTAQ